MITQRTNRGRGKARKTIIDRRANLARQKRKNKTKTRRKREALDLAMPNMTTVRKQVRRYGPMVAKAAGGYVTQGLNSLIRGFGDYKVNNNSVIGVGNSVPMFANVNGKFLFQRQEYLQDITASTDFSLLRFNLNPGLETTFPWLSAVAHGFEQYKLHGVVFYFRSLSSPNVLSAASNTALGAVIGATQYDPKDDPFVSKFEMENYSYSCSGPPYKDFLHPVECKKSTAPLSELLIRTEEEITNSDLSFYDYGVFSLAVTGCPSETGVIGELWISYEIELLKPKISNFVPTVRMDSFTPVSPANATPLGTSQNIVVNTLGGSIVSSPQQVYSNLILPVGTYLAINYYAQGGSAALNAPSFTYDGASSVTWFTSTFIASTGTSINFQYQAAVVTTETEFLITVGAGGTLPTSITSSRFSVSVLPPQAFESHMTDKERIELLEKMMKNMMNEKEQTLSPMLVD